MTLRPGPATRLTIYLKANAQWHHKPLYHEVVHRAHRAGLSGASVFHGDEGFGKSETIHTTHLLSWSDDLPCEVVIIDEEERLRGFIPQLDEILGDGIAFFDSVEVMRYVGSAGHADERPDG